jgi:hypothetical protein
MPTNLEIDVANFTAAARPYGDKVWISRQTQVFVREWMVENEWIQPGQTPDTSVYAAAFNFLIAAGTLPQKQKTAEEIAAEEKAAADLEARRRMGVMFPKDEQAAPARKLTDELINTDRFQQHNAAVDKKLNRVSDNQELHEAMDARMQVGAAIPGLKDEREQVYAANGMINHYRTGLVQEQNREHNQRLRAAYASRRAADAAEENSTKKGI